MAENFETNSEYPKSATPSVLAQNAGAFLAMAVLCTVGGLMAYGSTMKVANPWVIGCLIVGFISLAAWFVGRAQQARLPRDQYAKQRTLIGTNALFSTVLFFALLVGINYVATRRHKTFDLTNNKINSLSEQTTNALTTLKNPVQLTYVYAPTYEVPRVSEADKTLLDKYKLASDNVRVKYLNAVAEPSTLRDLSVVGFTGQPMIVIEPIEKTKSKNIPHQQVDTIDESNLTTALMKLGKQESRTLYYLTGHGELGFDSSSPTTSFANARSRFSGQNYTIKPLSLAKPGAKIPSDASVLAVLGPTSDLTPTEAATLQKYIAGKGRLLLALRPIEIALPRWKSLARSLGADALSGFVIDQEQFINQPQNVFGQVIDPTKHPVLGGVGENSRVIFPGAEPLKVVKPSPQGITATTLFESSPSSQSVPFRNGGSSESGPFALAIASERGNATTPGAPSSAMRAVVVCNPNFGSDVAFSAAANANFFLAAVNWLVGNDLLVSVPPKPPVTNTIDITPAVLRFITMFSLFAMPIVTLFIGGMVWWKRR